MSNSKIQWYPGHIAKAEKQLTKHLEKVDLVIEVRDARIPKSTSHPHLNRWIQGKKHLLVINREDMISTNTQSAWNKWFTDQGNNPIWCNAKNGKGVKHLHSEAIRAGLEINKRRESRGMLNRPVRALTLGFPNVGKSALINRLAGKKVVESAKRAGVTRTLRWVRMGQKLDLLDAPGVLPPRLDDQASAIRLAICDDIGQGGYDVESVAIELLKLIFRVTNQNQSGIKVDLVENRYGVNFKKIGMTENEWLLAVSQLHTSGNKTRMAQRILDDFRKTLLGLISLEVP